MAERAPLEPDIFLSYAREDEARARDLAMALGQRGFSVFWDREVPPGQTWHSYIGEALANARCVVVAWSSHSIASQWVIEEASDGKDRNVLVPVLFETVQPPFGFRAIQAANLTDWRPDRSSPAFDSLVSAVQRIVGGQSGSGTEAEPEPPAPPQPASFKPAPTSKPGAKPASPASRETRLEPVARSHDQGRVWSPQTVVAIVAGLLAIGVAGAVFWLRTQPEPTPSASVAETEASVGTAAPAPSETGERGQEMQDCPECPEMVLVPAGQFTMGSPPGESGRDNDEGPQRKVKIAEPFWVGKYEVTFAEWDACVADGGCDHKPDDRGWGRDDRPVISVSWNDANEYVDWLSQKTGQAYRLLSEAEWEYVARAGSATAYWWGDDVGRNNANCDGCRSKWDGTKSAPVGSFKANDFGLHDTAGNVWEWVQDCYHDSYDDAAPTDGSAWKDGDDCSRVLRGVEETSMANGADNARRTGPTVEKTYQFILWLIPTVQKFPKTQKFLLGDRIQTTALNVLEGLIEATYTKARRSLLSEVNVQIEKLRFLFRLAADLRYLDLRRYEFAARNLDEIGRLVGGWLRADRAAQA